MRGGEATARWRTGDGEEARLTPGAAAAAEVWSRGFLPLRARSEGSFRLRPAFPGTAVVLGDSTYEVLSETELPEDGLVVYRMRPWPEGEVVRDRVVYGPAFVRAAEAERERARVRERARPWRLLLYPLVGLLPEEEQERACDRLGLYAVTATLVSGLLESRPGPAGARAAGSGRRGPCDRRGDDGRRLRRCSPCPASAGLSAPCSCARRAARRRSPSRSRRCAPWARSGRAATAASSRSRGPPSGSGSACRTAWRPSPTARWSSGACCRTSRGAAGGASPWAATSGASRRRRRRFERGRLVYSYRLDPLGEGPHSPPPADAYAEEVLAEVRREWDGLERRASRGSPACSPPTCRRARSTTGAGPRPRGGPRWPRPWRRASSASTC